MSNWINLDESIKGRIDAVLKENKRVINLLIELGVLRESMVPGWHVIYTEAGPKDIKIDKLTPCLKLYRNHIKCTCVECAKKDINE